MDITTILIAIISIIGIVVGSILIPYLIKKFGKEKVIQAFNTLEYIIKIAQTFSEAIEQMYPDWDGEQKLQEVMAKVKSDLEHMGITYDEAKVRAAIEQAVFNFPGSIEELEASPTTITNVSYTN